MQLHFDFSMLVDEQRAAAHNMEGAKPEEANIDKPEEANMS